MLKELIVYFNSIKKTQAEMKITLSEIKKNLEGIKSSKDEAKNQIIDLEHKEEKHSIRTARRKTNSEKNDKRLRSLWDISKRTNIRIIGVPEGTEKEQEIENLFDKIMKENFLNLVKEIDIQVQEAQRPEQNGHKEDHTKTHHN